MSVEYSTSLCFGYRVPKETAKKIREGGDKNDYYDYEDYLYAIDTYYEDADYFLGKILMTVDAGDAFSLTRAVPNAFDAYAWFSEISKVLEKCGIEIEFNTDWCQPEFLVVSWVS